MEEFESLCQHGYLAIRKHSRLLLQLLEINSFSGGEGTGLPCLQGDAVDEVKRRLKLSCTDRDAEKVTPTQSLLSRVRPTSPHPSRRTSPNLYRVVALSLHVCVPLALSLAHSLTVTLLSASLSVCINVRVFGCLVGNA